MTNQYTVDNTLLAEVFDALDAMEGFLRELSPSPRGACPPPLKRWATRPVPSSRDELIALVMDLRRRIITTGTDAGVYTAAYLRAVLDSAVDGIIFIDTHGIVDLFNPAAERMFGYAAEEVIGRNVNMLMPPPHCDQHDECIARYLRTGEARIIGTGGVVEAKRKDGRRFPIHLTVGEVRIGDRRTFVSFLRDLSDAQRIRPPAPP